MVWNGPSYGDDEGAEVPPPQGAPSPAPYGPPPHRGTEGAPRRKRSPHRGLILLAILVVIAIVVIIVVSRR
jgi:hypothetical protein